MNSNSAKTKTAPMAGEVPGDRLRPARRDLRRGDGRHHGPPPAKPLNCGPFLY